MRHDGRQGKYALKYLYCFTFLVQPNYVKNQSNDYKRKNSNYSCQDNVIARAFAFFSSYERKKENRPVYSLP